MLFDFMRIEYFIKCIFEENEAILIERNKYIYQLKQKHIIVEGILHNETFKKIKVQNG